MVKIDIKSQVSSFVPARWSPQQTLNNFSKSNQIQTKSNTDEPKKDHTEQLLTIHNIKIAGKNIMSLLFDFSRVVAGFPEKVYAPVNDIE